MFIGDIELPIVSEISESTDIEVDEIKHLNYGGSIWDIDNITVQHEAKPKDITITGFVNEEVHSNDLSLTEQKRKLKNLRKNSKLDNTVSFRDLKGYLLVENVNLNDTSDSKIIDEVEIESVYFSWPKFYSESGL